MDYLNVTLRATKHLHENIGYLCDLKLVSIIRYDTKEEIEKLDFIKIKHFSLCKTVLRG